MLGVITGEAIAVNTFGIIKKWYLSLIDVFIFIVIITVLFNVTLVKSEFKGLWFLSFFFGFISSLISHSITTGVGFFGVKIANKMRINKINEGTIIIGLIRNLLNNGLSKNEIKNVLISSGLNKRKVNYAIKRIKLEEEPIRTKQN